jgi:hypothetical protein
MSNWDWVTISALATAAGTLVLAMATFASVRSANRAARVAERALLVGLRPLLVNSRPDDPDLKVGFVDGRWFKVTGGTATAEATDEAVYLAMSLRNVGSGIAVLDGWRLTTTGMILGREPPNPDEFQRLSRDLYVAVGDVDFWQGSFRDPTTDAFRAAYDAVTDRRYLVIDLLYSDHEGGQRVISRYGWTHRADGIYVVSAARHWHLDHPEPR